MATYTIMKYCFRCQFPPSEDEALKRCGRCLTRYYCSTTCQRNDWPDHKAECRTLAAGGKSARTRSTMRLGLGGSDPDDIYYIRTSKPQIQDISVSGPYYPLEHVLPQLRFQLDEEKSVEGKKILDDIVSGGDLSRVHHFTAPLLDGTIIRFEIVREKNAAIARSLPTSVWYVVVATPIVDGAELAEGKYPPMEDIELRGTFRTKREANKAATKAMEEERIIAGDDARVEQSEAQGLVTGLVIVPGCAETKIVEVRHYDGAIQPVN